MQTCVGTNSMPLDKQVLVEQDPHHHRHVVVVVQQQLIQLLIVAELQITSALSNLPTINDPIVVDVDVEPPRFVDDSIPALVIPDKPMPDLPIERKDLPPLLLLLLIIFASVQPTLLFLRGSDYYLQRLQRQLTIPFRREIDGETLSFAVQPTLIPLFLCKDNCWRAYAKF